MTRANNRPPAIGTKTRKATMGTDKTLKTSQADAQPISIRSGENFIQSPPTFLPSRVRSVASSRRARRARSSRNRHASKRSFECGVGSLPFDFEPRIEHDAMS